MSEEFDPYRKWLGIAQHELPVHAYRLLGIAPFEDDPDVIQNAADRQMAHIRTFQNGKHRDLSQRVLNELSAAKVLLLDPTKKKTYDQQLRKRLLPGAAAADKLPPVAPPTSPVAKAEGPQVIATAKRPLTAGRPKAKPKSSLLLVIFGVAGGAVVLGIVAVLVMMQTGSGPEERKPVVVKPDKKPKTTTDKTTDPTPPVKIDQTPPDKPMPMTVDPPEKTNLSKFELALGKVREAFSKRQLTQAVDALEDAESLQQTDLDEAELQRLRTLYGYLDEFWRSMETAIAKKYTAGEVIGEVGEDEVKFVSGDDERVTLHYAEADHTFVIRQLPARYAVLLAGGGVPVREARASLRIGTFLAFDGRGDLEQAKQLWIDAAQQGVKDAALATQLKLNEEFIASIKPLNMSEIPLPNVPNETNPMTGSKERLAVPVDEAYRDARARYNKRYGAEILQARGNEMALSQLLDKLLTDAAVEVDPALAYVLYEEAGTASIAQMRLAAIPQVGDALGQRWKVDGIRLKQQMFARVKPNTEQIADTLIEHCAMVAREAEVAGKLDIAISAANQALKLGEKLPGRNYKDLQRRVREWETEQDFANKAKAGELTLATDPSDAAAHSNIGRYQCFFKRKWETGLKHLAMGNIEEEKQLATDDLTMPKEAPARIALGEGWYALAKKKAGVARQSCLERSKFWLEQAAVGLKPPAKAAVESRLRDIAREMAPGGT